MPVQLPKKRRAGPSKPPEFRRRTPPTKGATRLMQFSLLSGFLLLAVLAAIFVPRALEHGGQAPSVTFAVDADGGLTVSVAAVSVASALDQYRIELNASGESTEFVAGGPLEDAATWGSGVTVTFHDGDGDGLLSVGDTFEIVPMAGDATYHLLLFHTSRDVDDPPCPCAVGQVRFDHP